MTPFLIGKWALQALALAVCIGPAAAQQGEPNTPPPLYSLSTSAEQEIDNDRLTVSLMAYREGDDPAALAQQVNGLMREALTRLAGLQGFDAIDAQTQGYRISPIHRDRDDRTIDQWAASQVLQLRTSDFAAGTEAIGALQDILQVQDMIFDVLPATRREATDALIVVALERFTARAGLIALTMGADSHSVIDVDVRTDNAVGYPLGSAATYRSADSSAVAPEVAAGSSSVSVSVSGRIALDDSR